MTCGFWFYIVVEEFSSGDRDTLATLFKTHGLVPDVREDCVQANQKIELPSGADDVPFTEAFTDAVWTALGHYVPVTFSWTYIEEPDEYCRYREREYMEWKGNADENESTGASRGTPAHDKGC